MQKKRGFIGFALVLLLLLILGAAAGAAGLWWAVGRDPQGVFTKAGILKILSVESAVYYRDDKTKLGTFFEGAHRDYVPFDSIPKNIINALVAAEDHDYWEHAGIDPKAIAYAMLDNIKAGRVRRGGSTLTQQTAKNLFNRKGRTLSGKFNELINALKLEKHFSKQDILEFYLNQFYVSGNGHGVGIAARYFFDKDLNELGLLECAFIAGSVKGPNQYNPFIQNTTEKKQRALKRAAARVGYVLHQMRKMEMISEGEYRAALAQPIPFHRGDFRFSLSTNMVMVKKLLESEPIQKILDHYDVGDWMAEGLKITTTLDPDLQMAAEVAVYRNLSRLDIILRGYHPPDSEKVQVLSHFEPGRLQVGEVEKVLLENGIPSAVEVRFGALRGRVEKEALQRFYAAWHHHESGSPSLPDGKKQLALAQSLFAAGSPILCLTPYRPGTVKAVTEAKNSPDTLPLNRSLEIAQRPLVQGGGQIVKEGRVLANVGGFGNTGYDRVNQARRQFGSTFKPLVYAAALELGWKPLDALVNKRQLFRVGTTFYFPKPDHHPEDTVSMAWAGRRSENIASVYLLYHLLDHRDFAQFWQTAQKVGMAPENFPMQEEFAVFVRDSLGLVLNSSYRSELRYQKATQDLALDLTFEGKVAEGEALKTLDYGLGFRHERDKYAGSRDAEDQLRFRLLKRCYLNYLELAENWERRMADGLRVVVARRRGEGNEGPIGIFDALPDAGWESVLDPHWMVEDDSVLVHGEISLGTLKRVRAKLAVMEESEGSPYTKENLYASQDFRAMVGLRFIVDYSRQLGIQSPLDPVLAYPLGVNVITLGEAVSAYQAFSDGFAYATKNGQHQLFIQKIALRDGKVIYEDYLERKKVVSDGARAGLEAILGEVIKGGTGKQIGRELWVQAGEAGEVRLHIPAYGKTGTTNDYRNAAFLGFIAAPRGPGKGFDPAAGATIGVYAGFDDNRPMVIRGFRGTGASATIPAWVDMAKAVVAVEGIADNADVLDLEVQATGEPGLFQSDKYGKYIVSRRTGLPVAESESMPGNAGDTAYTEDLSDEFSGPEATVSGAATDIIRIREE